MPIYEYTCEDCKKVSEILVRNAEEKIACTHCGGTRLVKQLSAFATTQSSSESSCGIDRASCPAAPCCGGKCSH